MRPIKKNLAVDAICILLMLLFVYAAASKLRDYQEFKTQLGQSPLLTSYAGLTAWLIPFIEILTTVLLFLEPTRLAGLYASYTLMVLFTAYIIAITRFADYVPCSCGGVLQHMTWDQHLVFNICFVFLSLAAILLYNREMPKLFFAKDQGKRRKPVTE